MPLQLRRGTNLQRQSMTEPLAAGELIYTTDTRELFIGDGVTVGGRNITQYTEASIKNLAASTLIGGTHSGITFEYDSVIGTIDATVDPDLSDYQGVIRASAFQGTLVADDSAILIDGLINKIELDGTVKGNIVPDLNLVYDIGTNTNRFRDIYLSGSSIFLGNATITSTGSSINLPAGSTVGGVPIGSGSGIGDGVIEGSTYKINIAADDSSIMINTDTEEVFASGGLFGNLTGNVIGNVTGDLLGNVTGDLLGNVTGNVIGNVTGEVFGNVIGDLLGEVTGNLTGLVFASDGSSVIVNSFNSSINAPGGIFGNLTGNVTGDLLGNVTGNVDGNLIGSVSGNTFGYHTGDVKGSLFGDDSSILVDATNGEIRGNYNNGTLSINDDVIISVGARPDISGSATDNPVFIGSDIIPNTIWLSSDNNFGIFTGLTDGSATTAISIRMSRGLLDNPQTLIPGDPTAYIEGRAYNGTSYETTGIFGLFTDLGWNGTPGTGGQVPGSFGAITLDINGNQNLLEFNSKGVLNAPVIKLTNYATSSLPSSPEKGWMAFDSDTNQFKGWNGTTWVVLG